MQMKNGIKKLCASHGGSYWRKTNGLPTNFLFLLCSYREILLRCCTIRRIKVVCAAFLFAACSSSPSIPDLDEKDVAPDTPLFGYADRYPAVKPSGEQIVFVRQPGTAPPDTLRAGLYLLDILTRELLLVREGRFGRPSWLDSNSIVVQDNSPSGGGQLSLLNLVTGEDTFLPGRSIRNPNVCAIDSIVVYDYGGTLWTFDIRSYVTAQVILGGFTTPSWSYDGSTIAAEHDAPSGLASTISLIDPDAGQYIRATSIVQHTAFSFPSWNASSSHIVCNRISSSNYGSSVALIDLNSGTYRDLVEGMYPTFSLNGEYIIYSGLSSNPKNALRIFRLKLDGGVQEQLTF